MKENYYMVKAEAKVKKIQNINRTLLTLISTF